MPQMMPMNWIMLFIFFIFIFLIFNIMNFYLMNYDYSKINIQSLKSHYLNWKW